MIATLARFAVKRGLLKAVPIAVPFAVKTGAWMINREKAVDHARKIGGRFGEVWIGEKRYFVVEKDGLVRNHFPRFDGPAADLEAAVAELAPGELRSPDDLLRERLRARRNSVSRRLLRGRRPSY